MTRKMNTLFDAHCHLQDKRLTPNLNAVMERAAQAGVTSLMCCGTCETDWPAVTAIAARFTGIRISFGLHPWYVANRTSKWLDTLKGLLGNHSAAVGEIGLDHALEPETFPGQEEVFLAQLSLATALKRPVSVHCRRAWGRMMDLLDNHGWPPHGIVFHSYSGGPVLVPELVRRGAWFSFSGAITHDNNKRGRAAVVAVPEDRLLIETDTPDIMPANVAARVPTGALASPQHEPFNEPANLPYIANAISAIRNWTPSQTASITHQNAVTFFALPCPS